MKKMRSKKQGITRTVIEPAWQKPVRRGLKSLERQAINTLAFVGGMTLIYLVVSWLGR